MGCSGVYLLWLLACCAIACRLSAVYMCLPASLSAALRLGVGLQCKLLVGAVGVGFAWRVGVMLCACL